jgi:hypothetical protein
MHVLSAEEVRRLRLATVDSLFEPAIAQAVVGAATANALTTAAQAQRKD